MLLTSAARLKKGQVSPDYETAVEFWTITDRLTENQANEHSKAKLPRKFQSSYSSAVEFSIQDERLCSPKSVAS